MRAQAHRHGKEFAKHISNTGFVSRIYKYLKRTQEGDKNLFLKISKWFGHFLEDLQLTNSVWKDAQQLVILAKCKLKLQRITITYSLKL